MRIPERGVGNMAFIIVLVLFIIAAAMAFMKGDEASEMRNKKESAEKATSDADQKAVAIEAAYRAVVEVVGLQDKLSIADGTPTAEVIRQKAQDWLNQQTAALVAAGTVEVNMPTFHIIEANLQIERQPGGKVIIRWFNSADADKVADFRGFAAPLPLRIKALADNFKKAIEEYERVYAEMNTETAGLKQAKTEADTAYAADARKKQGLLDELTRANSDVTDRASKLTQDVENLRAEMENQKTAYKKATLIMGRELNAKDNALDNLRKQQVLEVKEDAPDGEVVGVGRARGTVWINIGRNSKVTRGTKFKIWRVGKGGYRQDIAMIRVIRVDPTMSEARVIKQIASSRPISQGMNVSNPFFNPNEKLRVYIYGDLTNYDTDTARRRLAGSGVTVSRYLDDRVNIIVLGEPRLTGEELEGDEDNPAATATKRRVARDARLERVMRKAASIGAVVVTERVLREFVNF
ncbi:MAG: hypothetical protein O7E54_06770 [Planctomycetota bacterium]|nr:hypothetical protein [Planctomycetota bacterium]